MSIFLCLSPAPSSPPQYELTSKKKFILLNESHCDLKLVECVYYEQINLYKVFLVQCGVFSLKSLTIQSFR